MKVQLLSGIALGMLLVGCGDSGTEPVAGDPGAGSAPVPNVEKKDAVKDVSVEEAVVLLKGDVVVLDIRTPEEFADGHIAGATNINFNAPDFAKNLAGLDKSKSYLMHCRSGGRSGRALSVFKELGFESVYHLDKGSSGWSSAGQELVK